MTLLSRVVRENHPEILRQIDSALAAEDIATWRILYNELADTFYPDFDEVAAYCVSSYLSGGWMARIDDKTEEAHGFHIENVRALEVNRFPFLLDFVLLSRPVGHRTSRVEDAARKRVAADPLPTIRALRALLSSPRPE